MLTGAHWPAIWGLSPRVRGNLVLLDRFSRAYGSIPACAGESISPTRAVSSAEVYPRVCGGISVQRGSDHANRGLSPRVRGNPACCRYRRVRGRSIPACAGESSASAPARAAPGVYPRVCGGIGRPGRRALRRQGLSPRVRGNLHQPDERNVFHGSIPACARGIASSSRVKFGTMGLSPRVRGNRRGHRQRGVDRRSIPACAGESDWLRR